MKRINTMLIGKSTEKVTEHHVDHKSNIYQSETVESWVESDKIHQPNGSLMATSHHLECVCRSSGVGCECQYQCHCGEHTSN
ncbi:hypothetical protein BC833DRAFT_603462, partial [Globomyces pollinis-pini]